MSSILVWGAGAIGCYLGAKLTAIGENVELIGGKKLSAVGDTLWIDGVAHRMPEKSDSPKKKTYDTIAVTTKTVSLPEIVDSIIKLSIQAEIIAFTHNGIVEDKTFRDFKDHPGRVAVIVFSGYNLHENHLDVSESERGWLASDNNAGKKFSGLLQKAHIHCQTSPSFHHIVMEKFLLNVCLNALCSLEQRCIGDVFGDKVLSHFVDKLYDESYQVLSARYTLGNREEWKEKFFQKIPSVAKHYPSMYQDVVANRMTEIDSLNGYIVRLGQELNIPTPLNSQIYKNFTQGKCCISQTPFCLGLCSPKGGKCFKRQCSCLSDGNSEI